MRPTFPAIAALRTALVAVCLLLGFGGGGAARAEVDLKLWHSYRGQERAALEKVIALFNERNRARGVTATPLAVPYDSYADRISTTIPRGGGPDLFIFAQDRLGGWVEARGIVDPLDFYIDEALAGRYLPKLLDALTYRGQTYGLPFNYKPIAMIWNTALVTEPPATTGELIAWAKRNTDAASGRFAFAYPYEDVNYHAALMNAFGGGVFALKDNVALADPAVNQEANIASVELMRRWLMEDRVLPVDADAALVTSLFNAGKLAVVFNGPWFLGEVRSDIAVGVRPLPTVDEAGGTPLTPWMGVEGLFISANTEHDDEAFDLADFMTSLEAARIMALEGRQQPSNAAVYDLPEVASDPVLAGFRQQAETAIPTPNLAVMTLIWSPARNALRQVVKGTATPRQALDALQVQLERDIDLLRQSR